jgi:spermidine synthase
MSKNVNGPVETRLVLTVAVLLFLSGICALAYQVAWMRSLRLIFGASTAASAAVLAIFMGGLGLGNAVLGGRADETDRPLRLYGQLELLITVAAGLSPFLVVLIEQIYLGVGGQSALGLTGATVLRLLLSTLVLGGATFLMGGTLPAAARAVTSRSDPERRSLAWLYGANTLGAVVGAGVTTFLLLEHLGTWRTLWAACALNLLVGWIAYRHAGGRELSDPAKVTPPKGRKEAAAPIRPVAEPATAARRPWIVYGMAAVLGFAFFLMELVWYRMLGPLLGGTTFTFGLILAVALAGIGIGGLVYAIFIRRLQPTWGLLALTCGLEAAAIGIPFALGDRIAILAGRLTELGAIGFIALAGGWFVIVLIVVFPAALVSGAQFPLLIALVGRGEAQLGKQVGLAYAWNTLGAICGSLAGGFGALPLLSAVGTWKAVVWLLAAAEVGALAVAVFVARPMRWARLVPALVAISLALACTLAIGPTAVWRHSGIGAGRAVLPQGGTNELQNWEHRLRNSVLWEKDGVESAIAIMGSNGLSFIVNGKSDGNTIGDAGTQVGLAIAGAMLHPNPRKACVIGLGTGETAGWLADMRDMERVDVVELEPRVDEMARRSIDYNRNVLENPRVRQIYNDAREVLLATGESYDLIISEPSNPFRAGIATLFTQEFYQSVLKRLNRDGLFLQWLQAYEIDLDSAVRVMSTLRSVFPHVEIWRTQARDMLLVCSTRPLELHADELRQRMQDETLRLALKNAWYAADVEGFLARFVAGIGFLDDLVKSAGMPLNTDDHNRLEFGFAKTVGRQTGFSLGPLQVVSASTGSDRPKIASGTIDWNRVAMNRVAMVLLALEVEPEVSKEPSVVAAGRGLAAYVNGKFAVAHEAFQAASDADLPPVVELVLAHCRAELDDKSVSEPLRDLERDWPIEVSAIRFILAAKDSAADGDAEFARLIAHLKVHPWCMATMVERAIAIEVESAAKERDRARWLYHLLEEPFCGFRFEGARRWSRYRLAGTIGTGAVVEALQPFEPHVPWDEAILTSRAQAYEEQQHPLASRAAVELKQFQRDAGR